MRVSCGSSQLLWFKMVTTMSNLKETTTQNHPSCPPHFACCESLPNCLEQSS
ncbi:rCG52152 [Rattus norvegicus]|uniref:RCG52152 n=1 Tax=Rattus norvegicus TaxID=10116 RepID=A6K6Q8_RAT|nr:rCG52152 [Rattus norvegicus]